MISLALALIVLGMADLISGGLAAMPGTTSWKRRVGIAFILTAAASYAYFLTIAEWIPAVAYFAVLWIGTGTWLIARESPRQKLQLLALVALAITMASAALIIPAFTAESPISWLSEHIARLPWNMTATFSVNELVLIMGVFLFLGPTANGIVRCCLQIIRTTPVAESEKTLKGGRFIGPLERFLIFGLALAGEPTAAALIISAKSIIRFPELQSKSRGARAAGDEDSEEASIGLPTPLIDELTEYFLLGSLLSWALALFAALPFQ